MEREHRPPVSTFYHPGAWTAEVQLGEAAAHHARVKRLEKNDAVRLTSGDGRRVNGLLTNVAKRALTVLIDDGEVERVPKPSHIELWVPVGDRERMLWLAEKSAELGVSSWQPVLYSRSRSVAGRGEGAAFRDKVRARQVSALEQSGGAWLPDCHPERALDKLLDDRSNGAQMSAFLVLDQSGESLSDLLPKLACPICVAVGPEGGFEREERHSFARENWRPVSVADNVLRFETAGVAGLAIARSHFR